MTARRRLQLTLLLCCGTQAHAQEPAVLNLTFFTPKPAARYEQSPGVFHYVVPCAQFIDESRPGQEAAICWPVVAIQMRKVDGKLQSSHAVQGILTVSPARVRFIPMEQKDIDLWGEFPIGQASFVHTPGTQFALVAGKDAAYRFGMGNFCEGCKTGAAPLAPANSAQLDSEFRNISESIKQFAPVYDRMRDLALQMRVIVDARNQPLPGDLPVMMELYSQLNQRLAGVCQEPEKSCIQSYQAYQACKSGASSANCAAPKDCTATCSLPSGAYAGLKATACSPPTGNPVTLYPIWNEEFARQDADRAKGGGWRFHSAGTARGSWRGRRTRRGNTESLCGLVIAQGYARRSGVDAGLWQRH